MSPTPYQVWGPPHSPSALFFKEGSSFRISFPGIGDFRITGDGDVACPSDEAGAGDLWRGVLEQQVEPLLLSLRGEQVFHGGAVAVDGSAVAFIAPSGWGKSTLTTAFARRGHAFLSDDCLHLDLSGSPVHVHPHDAQVRLWEDSAEALAGGAAVYVAGSAKPRVAAGEGLPHCDVELPLSRVYVLGNREVGAPEVAPMSPSEQLIGWTANAFVLDIRNPDVLRRNLAAAARLVGEVPMRRLDYPRRYEDLDSVVDAVLADAAG